MIQILDYVIHSSSGNILVRVILINYILLSILLNELMSPVPRHGSKSFEAILNTNPGRGRFCMELDLLFRERKTEVVLEITK